MQRNSKKPSKYRFVVPMGLSMAIIAIVLALNQIQDLVCARTPMGAQCPSLLPLWVTHVLIIASGVPMLVAIRRFVLDFIYGEHAIESALSDQDN